MYVNVVVLINTDDLTFETDYRKVYIRDVILLQGLTFFLTKLSDLNEFQLKN